VLRTRKGAALAAAWVVGLSATGLAEERAAAAGRTACRESSVTVSVAWDRQLEPAAQGVVVGLTYPEGLLLAPDESGSAKDSVRRLGSGDGGLFEAIPVDQDGDGVDDRVNIGLVSEGISPGPFARVRFACRPDAAAPEEAAFACEPQVAGARGEIASTCDVELGGTAAAGG
jgi:hypothetical protein